MDNRRYLGIDGGKNIPSHLEEEHLHTSVVAEGAKAAADATRRAETTAVNFMVD
jgi:hypothetical protein